MSEKKGVKIEGIVVENLPNLLFKVMVEEGKTVLAHLGGKLKLNRIKIIPGDRVVIEMPTLNDNRGRIIRRL